MEKNSRSEDIENEVDIRIEITVDQIDESVIANSQWLSDLGVELQRELEAPCQFEKIESPEDAQAGDIVTAVAILNLSIASLALVWSILRIRHHGSITIEKVLEDGTKMAITRGNLTDKKMEEYQQEILQEAKDNQLRGVNIRVDD